MRLKYQLFLVLLFASALLILLMYTVSSWSFSRGLLGYVNNSAEQYAGQIVIDLESQYAEYQSWEWAQSRSPEWRAITSTNKPRPDKFSGPSNRPPKFILADSQKNVLIGPSRVDPLTVWRKIVSDENVVGYLGYRRLDHLDSQLDRAFETQQKRSFAYAGIAMALLSALLAAPLASLLVKPILRIRDAVEHISQGDYTQRDTGKRRDELGILSEDINQLARTLEISRDERQRWIAEISHELRTPISVLRGELEAIQDGVRPLRSSAVDSLHSEVLGLNRLVDDLHTLSLSDVGALDYRSELLYLEPLLAQFLDINRLGFTAASLSLRQELAASHSPVMADRQRLLQLLSNLFQNTVRYTNANGTVLVQTCQIDNKHVQILWSDSSPGVPDEALSSLFDPLFRVEQSRNRALGGAGLGLSIASRIVKAHGGSIRAENSDLGGLCIDIRLPLANMKHGV